MAGLFKRAVSRKDYRRGSSHILSSSGVFKKSRWSHYEIKLCVAPKDVSSKLQSCLLQEFTSQGLRIRIVQIPSGPDVYILMGDTSLKAHRTGTTPRQQVLQLYCCIWDLAGFRHGACHPQT